MVDFECGKCDWKGSHKVSLNFADGDDLKDKCPQCEIPQTAENLTFAKEGEL